MIVRRAGPDEFHIWAAMLARLHPSQSAAEFEAEIGQWTRLDEPYVGFLAFDESGVAAGMIDARVRNYAEAAPELRAAYVEDLWVEPEYRGKGVASQLLKAVEGWALEQGLNWLGSDARLDNDASHSWHLSAGFEEVERLVVFGKPIE